jgi:hypothetical protein
MIDFLYYIAYWLDFSWLITLPRKGASETGASETGASEANSPPNYTDIDPLLRT